MNKLIYLSFIFFINSYQSFCFELDSIKNLISTPYIDLTEKDSFKLPFNIDIELNVDEISSFDVNNDFFYSRLTIAFYSDYDSIYGNNIDTIFLSPDYWIEIPYKLGDESFNSGIRYDGYIQIADVYQYNLILENNFPHYWNLRDFPFDQQLLKIKFEGMEDTSMMDINMYRNLPSTINKIDLGLKDGYSTNDIYTIKSYKEINLLDEFNGIYRNKVIPVLSFIIPIDRTGSWLFIKLFLGSILAFIISAIAFLIPKADFGSKIELSVGALFVAIGNRYFVESSMPNVQVLTKADILHNLSIILIILNILLLVIQRNKTINWNWYEKKYNPIILTTFIYIIFSFFVIIL